MVITTSGSIASFKTPVKQPLKSLKVYFSPIQNGSGDPSPSNVRPISGRTGLEVTICGKNMFNFDPSEMEVIKNGDGNSRWGYFIGKRFDTVTLSATANGVDSGTNFSINACLHLSKDENGSALDTFIGASGTIKNRVFKKYESVPYVTLLSSYSSTGDTAKTASINKISAYNIQFELGSVATEYEAYTGTTIPVDWTSEAGTLYGGYVDLISGELVQTHYGMQINRNTITSMKMDQTNETYTQAYFINSNNSIPKFKAYTGLSNRFKCLNTTVAEVNSFINFGGNVYFMIPSADLAAKDVAGILDWFDANPTFLVAELSTPVTYQLQPVQLETLIGRNNIFSDADMVEAVYDHVDTTDMVRLRQKVLKGCQIYKTVLPPGYEEYDYLQRVGYDSRIDTGVDGTRTDLKFAFTYMPTSIGSYGCLFGNYTSEDTKCWRIIHVASTDSDVNQAFYVTARNNRTGASSKLLAVTSGESFINKKINFELELASAKSTVDGHTNTVSVPGTGGEAPSERTIAISASSPAHSGAPNTGGRFYGHFKIWGGTELIREYVPAVRLSDNKAGFYDLVNYTFNPSIGTADFIPGND